MGALYPDNDPGVLYARDERLKKARAEADRQAAPPTTDASERMREAEEGPCTDCDDTGVTFQTERICSCEAGLRFAALTPTNNGVCDEG